MANIRQSILYSVLFLGLTAHAGEVRWGSAEWDHAQMMPPGKHSLHFKLVSSDSTQIFGDHGQSVPMGKAYQSTQSFSDIGASQGEALANEFDRLMAQEGVDPSSVAWTTEFELASEEVTSELLWTRGLTASWMLGLRVPYHQSTTRVSTRQVKSPVYLQLQDKYRRMRSQKGQFVANTLESSTGDVGEILSKNEWEPLREEVTYQGLGDVEILSQIHVFSHGPWVSAFRQRIVTPTGQNQDPYMFIRTNSADGQMDLGADALVDYRPSEKWVVTALLGYTAQLSDTQAARVPVEVDNRIEWPVDPEVDRDLGDLWLARVNASYRIVSKAWITAGVEHTQKSQDHYKGQLYPSEYYDRMSWDTDEVRNLARVGLRYSSPNWRYSFTDQSRWTAGVEYLSSMSGRNTPQFDATAVELSVTY